MRRDEALIPGCEVPAAEKGLPEQIPAGFSMRGSKTGVASWISLSPTAAARFCKPADGKGWWRTKRLDVLGNAYFTAPTGSIRAYLTRAVVFGGRPCNNRIGDVWPAQIHADHEPCSRIEGNICPRRHNASCSR